MRLQVDNEFEQLKIQYLNNQNNVEMFTTSIRREKVFAAEEKIRKLKTRAAKLKVQKLKSPTKIILKSAANMNDVISEKYGLSPEEIETRRYLKKSLRRYLIFIEKTKLDKCMKDSTDMIEKKYKYKRKKLRGKLNIREKVLVLAERIKKISAREILQAVCTKF